MFFFGNSRWSCDSVVNEFCTAREDWTIFHVFSLGHLTHLHHLVARHQDQGALPVTGFWSSTDDPVGTGWEAIALSGPVSMSLQRLSADCLFLSRTRTMSGRGFFLLPSSVLGPPRGAAPGTGASSFPAFWVLLLA